MANYPKKDNKIGNIAAIIILIIAIVIYVRIDTPAQRSTVFKKTDVVFELQPDDRASAYSYGGKGFFIGTRGGMNFYNDNSNSPLWTAAYTPVMRTPVTDARGTYIGVCDALGSVFYMFSADGQMYALTYDNPVLSFSVNSSGYAAVISRDQNGYKVQALNPQGKEINCYYNQKPNVFPVSADVSANGSILSVALTDINEKHLSSKIILIYNNQEQRQENHDGIFFQIKKDDQLIAKLRFLDNNSLLFLSDAEMGCIRSDTSKEYWALPISNEISKFAVADKCIVLGYGAAIPGRESDIPFGTLKIYNFDMAEVGSREFGTDIIYLKQSGGAFTAGILGRYIMFGGDGKFLWEYTPTDDAKEIVPLENTNTVLSVSNIGAAVLKRSR